MKRKNKKLHPAIWKAIKISARFGFLTKEIFFKHISQSKQTMTYRLWNRLKNDGLFESSGSIYGWNLFKLSNKGREFARSQGLSVVSRPLYNSILRDMTLMPAVMALETEGLINFAVTQAYARDFAGPFFFSVGGKRKRIPSLYFHLNVPPKKVRVAVEYEGTSKNGKYYQQLLREYSVMNHTDMILFICGTTSTEKLIRKVCMTINYRFQSRPLAFANVCDVVKSPAEFPIRLQNRAISFRDFVHEIREIKLEAA